MARTSRRVPSALAAIFAIGVSFCLAACGGAATELAEARPAIDAFLAAVGSRRFVALPGCASAEFVAQAPGARLAPVLDSMDAVLGRRVELGQATARHAPDDPRAIEVSIPARHERGAATIELVAARGNDGRWLVSECSARSAAFTWVMR